MRVKIDWLNELVDLVGLSTEEIVNTASLYSIEIENVDKMVKGSNIVIGHVLTKVPHPNSDHLNLLTVDVKTEVLNIVCGAPNIEADQYVIVALSGAKLLGGIIKPSKIRGCESNGMVCSLQELGIENKYVPEKYSAGIYYFEDKVEVGIKGDVALQLDSPVLELGITPNRGDLLSMIGVAYEFSASFNRPLKPLVYKLERDMDKKASTMQVSIETDKCITYYAQIVEGITIKPSPRWLKARLIAFGIRPLNNCVDITNYILALYGQPLHAFDLDVIGHKIVVKNSEDKVKFITLDNIERNLSKNDIVITNGVTSMCLGGVMGGQTSEVTLSTKNIMLEAAVFDPMTIRKTATRLNLHSEASMRYERGVDTNRTKEALDYACYLFKTLADAKIVNDATLSGVKTIEDKLIPITVNKINSVLGVEIEKSQIIAIFKKLNFKVTENADTLEVSVPNRRPDITITEDLIEEVARLYGYAAMPSTLPLTSIAGGLTLEQKNRRLIEDCLIGDGLNQVVTYSLVTKYDNTHFNVLKKANIEGISILMPMVEDREVLRQSLIPSLLSVEKYNVVRKNKDISDFEISNIYYYTHEDNKKKKHEELHLGGVMSGEFSNSLWQGKQEKVDFYLVKGVIIKLFAKLGKEISFAKLTIESSELHPGRSAAIIYKNQMIGYMGELHPQYAQDTGLADTYVFEINISDVINESNSFIKFSDIPKLPAVERDIALVMQKDVQIDQVLACIKHSCKDLLTNATPFDLYIGENVGENEKSVAIKLVFESSEALTDEKIKAMIKRILKDLKYKMNITLREM